MAYLCLLARGVNSTPFPQMKKARGLDFSADLGRYPQHGSDQRGAQDVDEGDKAAGSEEDLQPLR